MTTRRELFLVAVTLFSTAFASAAPGEKPPEPFEVTYYYLPG